MSIFHSSRHILANYWPHVSGNIPTGPVVNRSGQLDDGRENHNFPSDAHGTWPEILLSFESRQGAPCQDSHATQPDALDIKVLSFSGEALPNV